MKRETRNFARMLTTRALLELQYKYGNGGRVG